MNLSTLIRFKLKSSHTMFRFVVSWYHVLLYCHLISCSSSLWSDPMFFFTVIGSNIPLRWDLIPSSFCCGLNQCSFSFCSDIRIILVVIWSSLPLLYDMIPCPSLWSNLTFPYVAIWYHVICSYLRRRSSSLQFVTKNIFLVFGYNFVVNWYNVLRRCADFLSVAKTWMKHAAPSRYRTHYAVVIDIAGLIC